MKKTQLLFTISVSVCILFGCNPRQPMDEELEVYTGPIQKANCPPIPTVANISTTGEKTMSCLVDSLVWSPVDKEYDAFFGGYFSIEAGIKGTLNLRNRRIETAFKRMVADTCEQVKMTDFFLDVLYDTGQNVASFSMKAQNGKLSYTLNKDKPHSLEILRLDTMAGIFSATFFGSFSNDSLGLAPVQIEAGRLDVLLSK